MLAASSSTISTVGRSEPRRGGSATDVETSSERSKWIVKVLPPPGLLRAVIFASQSALEAEWVETNRRLRLSDVDLQLDAFFAGRIPEATNLVLDQPRQAHGNGSELDRRRLEPRDFEHAAHGADHPRARPLDRLED